MPKKKLKIKKSVKTILTKRGYAIVKSRFSFKDLQSCKRALNVKPFINEDFGGTAISFPIYLESYKKMYLPKHYGFEKFGEPDQIKIDKGFEIDLEFKGNLRDKQRPVVQAFLNSCDEGTFCTKSNGGIISVPCGWGKTIMALWLIAKLGRKALIVVHKEFLMNQWKERIQEFLPDARVGTIQAKTIDIHNKDIVIGMLQSLSIKEYEDTVFDDFGFTIVDECHHIAAEVFSRSLPKINSYYSLGLSATPNRSDGLTKVFNMYLGPMLYRVISNDDKKVRVNIIKYFDNDNNYCKEEVTAYGKICVPKMINNIVENENRNKLIIFIAKRLVEKGKQVLLLSDRRNHLSYLYGQINKFTTVGYYIGGMKQKDLKKSEEANVILGTYPMSSEGLDIPSLDAAIFTTPKSSIEQSIGRITRKVHEDMPIAYDIVDNFSVFPNQLKKRQRVYKRLKYDVYMGTLNINNNMSEGKLEYFMDNEIEKLDLSKKKKPKKAVCLIEDDE